MEVVQPAHYVSELNLENRQFQSFETNEQRFACPGVTRLTIAFGGIQTVSPTHLCIARGINGADASRIVWMRLDRLNQEQFDYLDRLAKSDGFESSNLIRVDGQDAIWVPEFTVSS